jgi:hypothetical protein
LACQKDAAQPASAKLTDEEKVVYKLSCFREPNFRPKIQNTMTVEQHFQLRSPLREAPQDFLGLRFRAVLAAQAHLFVDKLGDSLRVFVETGVATEKIFRQDVLAPTPVLNHFLHQIGD